MGNSAPRVLSLDSYFLTEVERTERDKATGRRVKRKVEEYEFDAAMEASYRASLFRSFNKTLSEGFFSMVVVDAVNHKVRVGRVGRVVMRCVCCALQVCHFDRFWSNAKMNGFEVSVGVA